MKWKKIIITKPNFTLNYKRNSKSTGRSWLFLESVNFPIIISTFFLCRLQREQDGNEDMNKKYLKNVIMNYLNAGDPKMKSHMLNAIFTILKFSDIEMNRVLKLLKKWFYFWTADLCFEFGIQIYIICWSKWKSPPNCLFRYIVFHIHVSTTKYEGLFPILRSSFSSDESSHISSEIEVYLLPTWNVNFHVMCFCSTFFVIH